MFESITQFFKRLRKSEKEESKSTAKERLHLVLAQDRANISADFLEMMKQEILEVIKKYIDIDEKAIDVRLTNKESEDGSVGAPALYANIPILTIKNEARKLEGTLKKEEKQENIEEDKKEEEAKEEAEAQVDEQENSSTEEENTEDTNETDQKQLEDSDNDKSDEVDDEEENIIQKIDLILNTEYLLSTNANVMLLMDSMMYRI